MSSKSNVLVFAIALGLLTASTAFAATPSDGSDMTVPQTVGEMLKLDAARALATEQRLHREEERRLGVLNQIVFATEAAEQEESKDGKPQVVVEPPAAIDVLGIFGVENKLMADVEINGTRYRYLSGRSFPLGASDGFRFKLVKIHTPCVSLQDSKLGAREVCLRGSSL
ncbi:hypothetical protein [Pseudomonas sp. EMN2]|uniref:hypothetical protein n=1 Tax=Pseudomonas sp. EMN2 TaxID=2615212 RepID=UPI00129A8DC8|nr:hypothetical protein [Pseudomonas sp. EMN2]